MRYLGVDYGAKRIGLAISDHSESFAMPFRVISNFVFVEDVINEVIDICKKENIDEIVVGESKNFSQEENKIMEDIKLFVKKLGDGIKIPIHMHPEFLTSIEAERLQGKNDMNDASAAAIILKSYLDMSKSIKNRQN